MKLFHREHSLSGFSLVEMLVAIFIMGVGMIGFGLLLLSNFRSNKFIIETGTTAVQVNRAVENIVETLRTARQADNGDYPIVSGSDFDIKFYADIDHDGITERVHYYLDSANKQVKKGVTKPTAGTPVTYAAGDTTTTVVANAVVNTATQPAFFYYNQNYPGDTVNNPLVTPVAVQNVRLVRIRLFMNIDPLKAPNNINVESFVDLRNLETYDQ